MKINSKEYKELMQQWSDEAWKEEIDAAHEEYIEHEDMMGRLKKTNQKEV